MTEQRSLLDALTPIDPSTLVDRLPGIDAVCPDGKTETSCRWPYCVCYSPDRYPPNEKEAA